MRITLIMAGVEQWMGVAFVAGVAIVFGFAMCERLAMGMERYVGRHRPHKVEARSERKRMGGGGVRHPLPSIAECDDADAMELEQGLWQAATGDRALDYVEWVGCREKAHAKQGASRP